MIGEVQAMLRARQQRHHAANARRHQCHATPGTAILHLQEQREQQAERELDTDEPGDAVPGEIVQRIPALHQQQAQHKALGVDHGMIGAVIDGEIAAEMGGGAGADHQADQQQQQEQVQRIKPQQPRFQEAEIAFARPQFADAPAIDMGENETGQGEEELDPQIAARRDQVDQPDTGVMMPFAEVIQHDQQGRNRARARQRRDGGRFAFSCAGCPHPVADSSGNAALCHGAPGEKL